MQNLLHHKILGADGVPLVILHGLFGSLDNWISLGHRFAENRKVILVDLRNHGKSFHEETMNYSVMAEDVIALLDHLEIEIAHVLGHSMGGKVCFALVKEFEERLASVIVADMAMRAYEPSHHHIIEALQDLQPASLKTRQDGDDQLSQKIDDFGVRQFLLKNLSRKKDGGFAWKMHLSGIVKNYQHIIDGVELVQPFSRSALFIKGGKSNYITAADEEALYKYFPQAEIETLNAGHWVHAEQPDAFYTAVHEFLQNQH